MKICHLTINPIDYERRILNEIDTAIQQGYDVQVYAHGRPGEIKEEMRDTFRLQRIKTIFYRGGPLKFISFNLQLFIMLLARSYSLLHCHDLWVLPAAAAISCFKRTILVYDAHEYYAGLEIFTKKRLSKFLWLLVERIAIKRVDIMLTISEKLGQRFRDRYPRLSHIEIIRNLPRYEQRKPSDSKLWFRKNGYKVLVYQGHFRPGRGLENLIRAVKIVEKVQLFLIGSGELEHVLKNMVVTANLEDRVFFHGFIPTAELILTSAQGDIGVVLFEANSLNYAAALPNKFFEYIMAGLPVLGSDIETLAFYIEKYNIGAVVNPANVEAIAQTINRMIVDENQLMIWKQNALLAARELHWGNEEQKLIQIYEQFKTE